MEAVKNDDINSRHYDNEILGHLLFYDNVQKGEF